MSPQYKFTLDGSKVISEPIGWNLIIIELNRDKKYWSLVESIELPLMFYGNSADGDGGYDYLKEARSNGPDTQVEILVEISWDFGVTFETLFNGLLDFTELIDMETDRKFQCTAIRSSAWSRFINRGSVPVDVSATATEQTLSLPGQEVRQVYIGIQPNNSILYTIPSSAWGIIDWATVVRSEINRKSNLPRVSSTSLPVDLFEMEYDGYYTFTGDIYIADQPIFSSQVIGIEVRIQINNDTPIAWSMELIGVNSLNGRTHFYYDVLHQLQKGDLVRIYFFNTTGVTKIFYWMGDTPSGLSVIADTIWPSSTAESYFIHDVGRAILSNITSEEYFYSEYFGGINTDWIDYSEDGCGVFFRLLKGRHVRGASTVTKPFSMSWDELWEGIDPIFMLGAAYETLLVSVGNGAGGFTKEMLNVGPREMFFDASQTSITLEQYDMDFKLEISYDVDFLLTSIKHGYQKWQSQSISGNDDPQTQHTRATRFKTVGNIGAKDFEFLSSFVAAALTIEHGRRLSEVSNKDWPLDEDTFIIQANGSVSPDQVKLYSNDVAMGIENADTRYNLRLTPVSNFNRWIRWLSIGFQNYIGDVFTFVDGEGNTDMVFDNPFATGCEAEAGQYADEGGDIEVVGDAIMSMLLYKFSVPFTWEDYKAVRDNRCKAIRLNYRNNEGEEITVLLFIRSLKYNPSKSEADFDCWLKTIGPLIIDYEVNMQLKIDGSLLAVTPRWDVDYITPETTVTLSVQITVSTLEGDSAPFTGRSTVEAVVKKISNGGIAEGSSAGLINWVQNGNIIHSIGFNPGNDVSENSYTFTNVLEGDILVAEIFEGLTS